MPGWMTGSWAGSAADKLAILNFAVAAVAAHRARRRRRSYLQSYLTTSVGQRIMHDLRRTVYHHIHRLSLAEHDEQRTGDLISRVTSDIDSIQDFVTSALLGIVANVLTLLGIVGIMLYASWRFTLISLAIAPVLFVVVYFFTRRIKKAARDGPEEGERADLDRPGGLLLDPRGEGVRPRGLRGATLRAAEPGQRRGGAAGARHEDAALARRRRRGGDRNLPDARLRRTDGHGERADRRACSSSSWPTCA